MMGAVPGQWPFPTAVHKALLQTLDKFLITRFPKIFGSKNGQRVREAVCNCPKFGLRAANNCKKRNNYAGGTSKIYLN